MPHVNSEIKVTLTRDDIEKALTSYCENVYGKKHKSISFQLKDVSDYDDRFASYDLDKAIVILNGEPPQEKKNVW